MSFFFATFGLGNLENSGGSTSGFFFQLKIHQDFFFILVSFTSDKIINIKNKLKICLN